ncbi:50S ribosomal protein L30 [Flavobacteriaceae bacterium UJ101]|nr:50S ribosomal protein L30 [Flavobacteriaceae bacterium UJ101]
MAKIKVTLKRSAINRSQNQKRTLEALGLKKINQIVEHEATPQIEGMVRKVAHLVEVEK